MTISILLPCSAVTCVVLTGLARYPHPEEAVYCYLFDNTHRVLVPHSHTSEFEKLLLHKVVCIGAIETRYKNLSSSIPSIVLSAVDPIDICGELSDPPPSFKASFEQLGQFCHTNKS